MPLKGVFARHGKVFVIFFVAVSLFVLSSQSAEELLESTAPVDVEQEVQQTTADFASSKVITKLQMRMQQEISVDFRDTPIDDALRAIADQADIDVVKSPKVTGSVTASLSDVPLEEALTNILAAHDYGYISTENMIRIVPRNDIIDATEKLIDRVYRITYADAKEVEKALSRFVSKRGSISSNSSTSNILVTDVESKIKAIDSFIEEIDRITTQILVEARIYDVTAANRLDFGVEWQLGTNTTYGDTTNTKTGEINPFATGLFSGTLDNAQDTSGTFRFGYLSGVLDIDAVVTAEHEDARAKLLANPRILVVDNEEAIIKIVEEIPFQELTETAAGGQIGTTQFREVGVELKVIPHLTRDGLIRLKLNPKFSIQTGQTGANSQPIVAKRETITTALIQDAQTVVIGGLRKSDITEQVNKVPLLGDVPIVGELFKFQSEKVIDSELVVFITPYIIEEPTLSPDERIRFKETELEGPPLPSETYSMTSSD